MTSIQGMSMVENFHDIELIALLAYAHDLERTVDTLQKHPEDWPDILGLRPDVAALPA